ncbi:MAG: dienelactone hydrolase family protein [Pseudomonadota bacterium]
MIPFRLSIGVLVLFLTACVSISSSNQGSSSGARERPPTFDYVPTDIAYSNHDLPEEDTAQYQVKRITIPSAGDNGQTNNIVTARYYIGRGSGAKSLLILLPIWGSYTYPPDVISAGIMRRSRGATNVLVIEGEDFLVNWYDVAAARDLADFDRLITQMGSRFHTSVIDTRRYIDWAAQRQEIDQARIGLIGFSMGALVGSLVTASDDRLAASVLVMGAADLPEVMSYCSGRPGMARESLMNRFNWSTEQYRNELTARIGFLDPRPFTPSIDPQRVFMIDAYYDDCMPATARDALWQAMGEPRRMSFLAGHRTAFLFMTPLAANYMRGEIYQFLEQRLASQGG